MKQRRPHPLILALLCALGSGSGCSEADPPQGPAAPSEPPPQLFTEREPGEIAELVEIGRRAFVANACTDCHSVDGRRSVGPPLMGIFNRPVQLEDGQVVQRDPAYLYRAVRDPQRQTVAGYPPRLMPSYADLDTHALVALVEYLKSLTSAESPQMQPTRRDEGAPAPAPPQ